MTAFFVIFSSFGLFTSYYLFSSVCLIQIGGFNNLFNLIFVCTFVLSYFQSLVTALIYKLVHLGRKIGAHMLDFLEELKEEKQLME